MTHCSAGFVSRANFLGQRALVHEATWFAQPSRKLCNRRSVEPQNPTVLRPNKFRLCEFCASAQRDAVERRRWFRPSPATFVRAINIGQL